MQSKLALSPNFIRGGIRPYRFGYVEKFEILKSIAVKLKA